MAHEFVSRNGIVIENNGLLKFTTSGSVNTVNLQAPEGAASGNYTLILPSFLGGSGQTLKLQNGVLNFSSVLSSGDVSSGYIGNNAVLSGSIASGQITGFHIVSGFITAGSNTSVTYANGNYTINATVSGGVAVEALTVTSGLVLASGTSFNGSIANTIGIASGGVISNLIADNAVVSGKVASGSIGTNEIASGSVTANHIASGAIIAVDIADNAVVSGKIANFAIINDNITSGTIANDKLANSSISINGASTALGASYNNAALTIGAGLTGGSYNGSGAVTIALASGGVVPNNIGSGFALVGSGTIVINNIASGFTLVGSGSVVSGSIASGSITINELVSGTVFTVLNAASGRVITSLVSGSNTAQAQSNITYDGSNFSINSTTSGALAFSVNTSSGSIPTVFAVSTEGYIKTNSALYSGQTTTFNPILLRKTAGDSAFFDYFAKNTASGFSRAGSIIVGWDAAQNLLEYNEYSTTDISGPTVDLTFGASLPATGTTSGYVTLTANIAGGTWNLKIGARVI